LVKTAVRALCFRSVWKTICPRIIRFRAIDVFVDELDLAGLGFSGVEPEATGRPAYHPATLLKIYVYGYLNRVQSSRRLERECQRNIELVWLTGRLMPDFKTIADFRKDNGEAIRKVCREFVCCAAALNCLAKRALRSTAASSRASTRGIGTSPKPRCSEGWRTFDESIARYLSQLDSADRQGEAVPEAKITRLKEKIATLREEIQRLNGLNTLMMQTEDKQISMTDPDARSMATSGRGSGMVGYNVQSAVDTKHHLIVSHEVTNVGSDRSQLSRMTEQARAAVGSETIEAVADRGYYSGEEIVACEQAGLAQLFADACDRHFQVRPDIIGQRLQRRDIDDLDLVLEALGNPLSHQIIDCRHERGERLARAGWRGNQDVTARLDQRPCLGLGRRRHLEVLVEPGVNGGMEQSPGKHA
jgi:TolA-binding protein